MLYEVITDSTGYIHHACGIDLDAVKQIKEVDRKRLKEYTNYHVDSIYTEGTGIAGIKCDISYNFV